MVTKLQRERRRRSSALKRRAIRNKKFSARKKVDEARKKKSTRPSDVFAELMKFKSFRESTPITREKKLTRAIQRRRK